MTVPSPPPPNGSTGSPVAPGHNGSPPAARKPETGARNVAGMKLHYDVLGRLVLTEASGKQVVDVMGVRTFPLSDPLHWISLCDAEGHEVLLIEDPAELPAEAREVLDRELHRRDFIPTIQQIRRISSNPDPTHWDVETDRGFTRFVLNGEDDIRRLDTHRLLIRDARGIRYLIPDVQRLDKSSRKFLARYL